MIVTPESCMKINERWIWGRSPRNRCRPLNPRVGGGKNYSTLWQIGLCIHIPVLKYLFETINLVFYFMHRKLCTLHKKMCSPAYWKNKRNVISTSCFLACLLQHKSSFLYSLSPECPADCLSKTEIPPSGAAGSFILISTISINRIMLKKHQTAKTSIMIFTKPENHGFLTKYGKRLEPSIILFEQRWYTRMC